MQPRSRSARHGLAHKEALEKERLRHRTGQYFRYEDIRSPIDVAPGCPSFLGGRDRMVAGNACEEVNFAERERSKIVRDEVTEARRLKAYSREELRWRAINNMQEGNVQKLLRMQQDPMMGRKNVSGAPFNIVNGDYDKSQAGAQLQHHDQMIRYSSRVRAASLAMRNHMGFNPIIGEQTYPITLPPPPRPPPLALA